MLYQLSYRRSGAKDTRTHAAPGLASGPDRIASGDRHLPLSAMKRPGPIATVVGVFAALLIALLVYGVAKTGPDTSLDAAVQRNEKPAAPGSKVSLPMLGSGPARTLAGMRGQVVVLNFWASWCDPCEREAPILERAQMRLQKLNGTVLGVTYKDYAPDSRAFVRRLHLTYPSLRDDKLELAPKYGTIKLPETFIIDRRGRVVAISRGELNAPFLARAIDRALGARA